KQGIDENLIGGNKSAEDACDDVEDGCTTGCNVVMANRLVEIPYKTFKELLAEFKPYIKKVKEHMKEEGCPDEEVKGFEKAAMDYILSIKKNFKEYQFFQPDCDLGGGAHCIVFMWYPEKDLRGVDQDGFSPVLTVFKHAVKQVKVVGFLSYLS
ncbi:predicted protein, partial [Nematostella vectensis]